MSTDQILKSLYTTIFCQRFSSDGNTLAVSDNFGHISLFNLRNVLSTENVDKLKSPFFKFKVANSSLYTMTSSNDFIFCAPTNEIVVYKWKEVSSHLTKPASLIKLPINDSPSLSSMIEINSLVYDSKDDTKKLFAGCGNGEIYCFDLEYNKLVNKIVAHRDVIYKIILKNNQTELVSASEDGEVKIWDLRTKNAIACIKPHEDQMCSRPNLGKFITCVSVDDDNWMVCGGGPRLAMWHLRSLKPMSVLEFEDNLFIPNVCKIYDNQIISGGNKNRLFYHTFENKLKSDIKTSMNCIYDITINKVLKANKILCVAGNGPLVDVCSNFAFKALTLTI